MASERITRQPTGQPTWPFVMLTGGEGAGKSWAWAEFSASPLIGRTLVVELGETQSDSYGAIPGARYELIEHDGTQEDMVDALQWASDQPRIEPNRPNMLVYESGSLLWELLGSEQQAIANARARAKARKYNKPEPLTEATITADQWGEAKDRWYELINVLRLHDGPAILTTRLENVMVVDGNGQPTKDRIWKTQAHKNIAFEVDAIVEMPYRGEAYLTKVKSTVMQLEPGKRETIPDFSLERLMNGLGLHAGVEVGPRKYTKPRHGSYVASEVAALENAGMNGQRREQDSRQTSRPPAGPDPQLVEQFRAQLEDLAPEDVEGWRAALDRGRAAGVLPVEVTGPNGQRIQLGAWVMAGGRRAAQLVEQEAAAAPVVEPESPADDPAVQEFIGGLDVLPVTDTRAWQQAYAEARRRGIQHLEIPDGDGGRVPLGRYLMDQARRAAELAATTEVGGREPDHAERAAGSGQPGDIVAATGVTVSSQ